MGKPRKTSGKPRKTSVISWVVGRAVLAILIMRPQGTTAAQLGERLKISSDAARMRLRARAAHGHARLTDPRRGRGAWQITPAGRDALERDQDSEV